jgi:hypothetical protein
VLLLAAASTRAEGIRIKRQLKPGHTYTMEVTMEQSSKINVAGREMNNDMNVDSTMVMAVKEGEKPGQKLVKMTYGRMAMKMNVGGQEMNYDSTKPDEASGPLGEVMGKIAGKSFNMVLDEKNEVLELKGMEELKKELGPMGQMFGKESFSQMLKLSDLQAPDRDLKTGEIWPMEIKLPLPGVGNLSMRGDCTYEKDTEVDGRKCALIEVGGIVSLKGDAEKKSSDEKEEEDSGEEGDEAGQLNELMKSLNMKMTGKYEGKVSFDTELGLERVTEMKMNFTMTMNNPAEPGKTMTVPMKQRMVQKLISVK